MVVISDPDYGADPMQESGVGVHLNMNPVGLSSESYAGFRIERIEDGGILGTAEAQD